MATQADISTVPIIGEYPDQTPEAVLHAVLNNTSLVAALQSTRSTDLVSSAEKYYKYARDNYFYGLPEGTLNDTLLTDAEHRLAVKAVLDALFAEPVTIIEVEVGGANAEHLAYEIMQAHHGFVRSTTVDPVDIPVTVYGMLSSKDNTAKYSDAVYELGVLKIEYIYDTYFSDAANPGSFETAIHVEEYPIPWLTANSIYVHVVYQKDSDPTSYLYWNYAEVSGKYPSIASTATSLTSDFYPVIPLYVWSGPLEETIGTLVNASAAEKIISTSKKAVSKLGIDFDALTEQLTENDNEESIDGAFLSFTIDMRDDSELVARYLYTYFDTASWWEGSANNVNLTIKTIRVTVGNSRSIYQNNIRIYKIYEETVQGVICPVGTYKKTYVTMVGNPARPGQIITRGEILLNFQETAGAYKVIHLVTPEHISYGYRGQPVITTIAEVVDNVSSGYIIPLSRTVMLTMSKADQEELLKKAIRLVVYSAIKYDVEWYETSAFRAILMAVAVVYGIITFDPSAITATSALTYAATAYALKLLAELVIEHIGGEAGLILAAAIAAVSIYYGDTTSFINLPFAEQYMLAATSLISAVNAIALEGLSDLQDATANLLVEQEAFEEQMEKASDLLGNSLGIDPFSLINNRPVFNPNESPHEYYMRTTHITNPGVVSLDAISDYVLNTITLPKANDINLFDLRNRT